MRGSFLFLSVSALALGVSAAQGADVYYEQVPQAGDVIYAPESLMTADVAIGGALYGETGYSTAQIFGWARFNAPFGGGAWNFTGEAAGAFSLSAPNYSEVLGAGHLYHKTEMSAHGVFLMLTGASESGSSASAFGGGVEGAWFLPSTTLTAQLGVMQANGGTGNVTSWMGAGTVRQYLTPNTKVSLSGQVWSNGAGGGIGAEHLFQDMNTSAFANGSVWASDGVNAWQVTGGLRFFLHAPAKTLQQHDWDTPFTVNDTARF